MGTFWIQFDQCGQQKVMIGDLDITGRGSWRIHHWRLARSGNSEKDE